MRYPKRLLFISAINITIINPLYAGEIFPETSDENIELLKSYKASYEEFGELGFLVADNKLQYTIKQDILEHKRFDQIKKENNLLNILADLSKNHWIALNKRDLTMAKNIAGEMESILTGKYGLRQFSFASELQHKIISLKYRCIEQIEMSLKNFLNKNFPNDLYKRNNEELSTLYQLARDITNTPFFRTEVSYDFMKAYGINVNPNIVVPILEKGHKFIDTVFTKITQKYPVQKTLLEKAFSLKKQAYNAYLNYIYNNLNSIKYSKYKSVDRGQTSGTSRNTCMFNSMFFYDLLKHNISSTKIGSLEKAEIYLSHLGDIYKDYGVTEHVEILDGIQKNIIFLKRSNSADAIYSFCSEIQQKKFFPGFLSSSAVLEIQTHALMANFAIFPKVITNPLGDKLMSHYGTGYYASENFPIIPVSCSFGHAQSLVRM